MEQLENQMLLEQMFGPGLGLDQWPEIPPNEIEKFMERARLDTLTKGHGTTVVENAGWDSPLTPLEKRSIPSIFAKGTVGHKLGLTRVEEKVIDGETWQYGYRGDELVDAQLVRP